MSVRLKQHQENALRVAQWCQTRPEIKRVMYPALPDDLGHELWQRDFQGASGLLGLVFKTMTREAAYAFAEALDLFSIGYSWGGFESLVALSRPDQTRQANEWTESSPIVRLHIGLEDAGDLIADLEKGFQAHHNILNG
jgi:cystathionine beta-lyase